MSFAKTIVPLLEPTEENFKKFEVKFGNGKTGDFISLTYTGKSFLTFEVMGAEVGFYQEGEFGPTLFINHNSKEEECKYFKQPNTSTKIGKFFVEFEKYIVPVMEKLLADTTQTSSFAQAYRKAKKGKFKDTPLTIKGGGLVPELSKDEDKVVTYLRPPYKRLPSGNSNYKFKGANESPIEWKNVNQMKKVGNKTIQTCFTVNNENIIQVFSGGSEVNYDILIKGFKYIEKSHSIAFTGNIENTFVYTISSVPQKQAPPIKADAPSLESESSEKENNNSEKNEKEINDIENKFNDSKSEDYDE